MGKGFHMTFSNKWQISVQFGDMSYCDNGETTAEIAIFTPEGDFFEHKDFGGDQVKGWCSPDEVLQYMNWAANQQ